MPEPPPDDPLAALREHVRHAHAAAERLAFDAAGAAGAPRADRPRPDPSSASGTPASGWAAADEGAALGGELRALVELVESLQALLPAELREQLRELVRQILLLIRTIVDWLVQRMQGDEPARPAPVRDIPIR